MGGALTFTYIFIYGFLLELSLGLLEGSAVGRARAPGREERGERLRGDASGRSPFLFACFVCLPLVPRGGRE